MTRSTPPSLLVLPTGGSPRALQLQPTSCQAGDTQRPISLWVCGELCLGLANLCLWLPISRGFREERGDDSGVQWALPP